MLEVKGLDELQRRLKDLSRRAENLSGTHSVPLTDLLTPEFLAGCSCFGSADQMFEASGFKVESKEDFEAIPDADWDSFIRGNTSYASWDLMLGEAVKEHMARELGF